MSLVKGLTLGCLLAVATFCYMAPTTTLAQTGKPAETAQEDHDQILQQLISEIRELRLAIQRAGVSNTRFQMLVERVRIQRGQVDALTRRLDDLRSQATNIRTEKSQTETRLEIDEELLDRTPDPERHTDLESQIKFMKAGLNRLTQEGEQMRDREAAANSELQTAKAKLDELDSQLDSLMSELKGP